MKPVNMRWTGLALALGLALIVTTDAQAVKPKHKSKPAAKAKMWTGAENGLIGIKLYDTGLRVLDVYGTPDQIEPLSGGSVTNGGKVVLVLAVECPAVCQEFLVALVAKRAAAAVHLLQHQIE